MENNINNTENTVTNHQQNYFVKPDAPNSIAVLILGIVSLVLTLMSCGIGGGVITGIIGLFLGIGSNKAIKESPNQFSEKSIKNTKAGKIMSLIGLIISAVGVFVYIVVVVFAIILEGGGF